MECNRCGYTKQTEIHHKDRNRSNSAKNNLERLCPNCHAEEHRNDVKEWAKRGRRRVLIGRKVVKVYVEEQTKAKLEDRAGRESLSSFVSGLIDGYFEEYPGLSDAEMARMPKFKVGDTVTIKKPARFVPTSDVDVCLHGYRRTACPRCSNA